MKTIELTVFGRTYRFDSSRSPEVIREMAERLRSGISQTQGKYPQADNIDILVLSLVEVLESACNTERELLQSRQTMKKSGDRLRKLERRIEEELRKLLTAKE